jgi:ferric-dicitrate binding protein FerR (iron transport regulator)
MNPFEKESFLNWLMDMPEKEAERWEKWSEASDENRRFVKQAKLYLSAMRNRKTELKSQNIDALWMRIETSIGIQLQNIKKTAPAKVLNLRQITKIAAAASIILFIGLGTLLYLNQVKLNVMAGEKTTYTLPDGSVVTMNAAGKITYNKLLWKVNRNLSLKGEAYFKVTKGEKFTVKCPTARVSVLGTSFNIKAHDNYFKTECYTGRVRVEIPDEKFEQVITKNEAITAGRNQKAVFAKLNSTQHEPSWLNGEFFFNNVPFELVLQEVENQFNVKFINHPADENMMFTGYFNNKDLNRALEFVLLPMGYKHERNGNQINLDKILPEK